MWISLGCLALCFVFVCCIKICKGVKEQNKKIYLISGDEVSSNPTTVETELSLNKQHDENIFSEASAIQIKNNKRKQGTMVNILNIWILKLKDDLNI